MKLNRNGFGLKEEIIYIVFIFSFALVAGYYLKDLVRMIF